MSNAVNFHIDLICIWTLNYTQHDTVWLRSNATLLLLACLAVMHVQYCEYITPPSCSTICAFIKVSDSAVTTYIAFTKVEEQTVFVEVEQSGGAGLRRTLKGAIGQASHHLRFISPSLLQLNNHIYRNVYLNACAHLYIHIHT